jgi:hypothetical protein
VNLISVISNLQCNFLKVFLAVVDSLYHSYVWCCPLSVVCFMLSIVCGMFQELTLFMSSNDQLSLYRHILSYISGSS